jgi:hypothetical protein
MGKMEMGFWDVLTTVLGCSSRSSSARNTARKEIEMGTPPWLKLEEDEAWGCLHHLWQG